MDVLVLGGGINGAGIARDLCLRDRHGGVPLRVGLVEQRHFASGTSGKNSQLIHGGLRYLRNLKFGLVHESLRERALLRDLAPGPVAPLRFLLPFYSRFEQLYYRSGLVLYDILAGRKNVGQHRGLSRDEALAMEPKLASEGLVSAALFYDCRVNSARFVLANVFDAMANGAAAANYVRAEAWEREPGVWRIALSDALTGEKFEARARKLVDATGPWSHNGALRLVRGSHIILPRVTAGGCAVAWFDESGRIVFIMPWGESGELSLVGTTNVDHDGTPDDVRISADEMRYLLGVVKRLFPGADRTPIAAYSALRPLLQDEAVSPTHASREHRIWNTPDGILRVAGGKYTTYRRMSEEAADLVCREVAPTLSHIHLTARTPLAIEHPPAAREERIAFAVRREMAQRLADLFFVSTYWGYEQKWNRERLARYAQQMAHHLGWDDRRTEQEIDLVLCLSALPSS